MGVILDLLAGLAAGVASSDIVASADRVCGKIVHRAALRLALTERERRESEWLAHLVDCQTATEKYRHAIGCYLAAPRMRRAASRVSLQLNFVVAGVGSLPLELNLTSFSTRMTLKILSNSKSPEFLKTTLVFALLMGCGLSLLFKARRYGREQHKAFIRQLPNFKDWTHQATLKTSRIELDFTTLISAMKRNPDRAVETFKKYMEGMSNILKRPDPEQHD